MAETNGGDDRQASSFSKPVTIILFCLRLAVGWHFLYEGFGKLLTPAWTSAPYLILSRGLFSGFFHWLGSSPGLVRTVDVLNIWGLILIGLALMLGCFTRLASASGVVLLALYYLAQPPLIQTDYRIPLEGHYLLVNKNVVELLALIIFLVLPSGTRWGLGRLIRRWRAARAANPEAEPPGEQVPGASLTSLSRREALEDLAAVPLLGVLGYGAHKKYDWEKVHAVTGATIKLSDLSLKDLKGQLPQGTLGKLKMSRLILGGNLIGGGAHARDLLYVSSLFKAYNTDRKVFETLELAERAGVNTFLLSSGQMPMFNRFRELNSSKMLSMCQVMPRTILAFLAHPVFTPAMIQDFLDDINRAIDHGVDTIYVNGAMAERFVQYGRMDLLVKALDRIKSQGYPAGLGGHSIEVPIQCEKAGLQADYYVKTMHHDNYWSAQPRENRVEYSVDTLKMPGHNQFHDNIFDLFPEKTVEVMEAVKKPFVAFKVLAGGAIPPSEGFKYAFENGADFICVGMLDFQIVEDVNIALDVLGNLKRGPRPWYA